LTTVSRDQVDMQHIFTINDQHKILVGGTYDNTRAKRSSASLHDRLRLDEQNRQADH